MWDTMSSADEYRLLRRPRSLPDFTQQKPGSNALYKVKAVYYKHRGNVLPRACYNASVEVCFSQLLIKSSWPPVKITLPLVSICYIEAKTKYDRFEIKGRSFTLHLAGFQDVMYPTSSLEESRDWLRFLCVRQRIPHSILKIPFDWEVDNRQLCRSNNKNSFKKLKNFLLCHKNANQNE